MSKTVFMKNKLRLVLQAAVISATISVGTANAAVPLEITDAITASQTDGIAMVAAAGAGGVAVMAVAILWSVGLAIVPKFLKRGARA